MKITLDRNVPLGAARLEGEIVATVRQWALDFPHELVALDGRVKALRREYAEGRNGMSQGKTMMHTAEIPQSLASMMNKKFGRFWSNPEVEPELWKLFKRNFTVGMIRR